MKANIKTQRLILRNYNDLDAESMFLSYCNDEEVVRYLTWYPHLSIDYTQDYLSNTIIPNINKETTLELAITLKEHPNTVIGNISIVDYHKNTAEIGYVLGKEYWNQGLASESLSAFIEYIFDYTSINTLTAYYDIENLASANVLKKCGFIFTHEQYDKRKYDSSDFDLVKCYYCELKR